MIDLSTLIRELDSHGYAVRPKAARSPAIGAVHLAKIAGKRQEHFAVLTLNTKFEPIKLHIVGKGIVDACVTSPREVFYPAIKDNAHSIMIAHNHPSGDTGPSPEDWAMTEKLIQAGKIMQINVVDHIIMGETVNDFRSLREMNPGMFQE